MARVAANAVIARNTTCCGRKNGGQIVYIGDGFSDRCAARQADVVFAKADLAQFCQQSDIPYVSFTSFREIMDYLEKIDNLH